MRKDKYRPAEFSVVPVRRIRSKNSRLFSGFFGDETPVSAVGNSRSGLLVSGAETMEPSANSGGALEDVILNLARAP